MELKQLEYFLTVSKLQSFTLAAEQLYVSQPGVTTAIKRLEEELGIQLFIRNKKAAILTAEGRVFFNHIELIMSDVAKAITTVTELKALNSGTIRLGLSPASGVSILTFLLAKFHALHPALDIQLIEEGSLLLQKQVEEGTIDFAVVGKTDECLPESVDISELGQQEFRVAVPTYHLLKTKASLRWDELLTEPLVLLKEDCASRSIIDEKFRQQAALPEIAFSSNSLQTMKRLIVCGAGLSILPMEALENDQSLKAIPLDPPLYIPFVLIKKRNQHLSHAAETLFAFIKKSLQIK